MRFAVRKVALGISLSLWELALPYMQPISIYLLISSQDEYMKKKFQDLLVQEKNSVTLPVAPAQVF
jgi:hypothetical protein